MSKLVNASELLRKKTQKLEDMRFALIHFKRKGDFEITSKILHENCYRQLDVGTMINFSEKNSATAEVVSTLIIKMLEQSILEMEIEITELATTLVEITVGGTDGD